MSPPRSMPLPNATLIVHTESYARAIDLAMEYVKYEFIMVWVNSGLRDRATFVKDRLGNVSRGTSLGPGLPGARIGSARRRRHGLRQAARDPRVHSVERELRPLHPPVAAVRTLAPGFDSSDSRSRR